MLMGNICTRNCGFCGIKSGEPEILDEDEPSRVANAVKEMGLKYVVITSVTRDDLPDGGAAHFARTVEAVRQANPQTTIEVLDSQQVATAEGFIVLAAAQAAAEGKSLTEVVKAADEMRDKVSFFVF